jgi:tetratricopeptide (TPR) repeat protein
MKIILQRKTINGKDWAIAGRSRSGNVEASRLWRIAHFAFVFLSMCTMASVPMAFSEENEVAGLTELLNQDPNNVDLLKQRAALLRLEQKHSESLGDLDQARRLNPNDHQIRLQRALTLSALHRDREAETELDDFLGLETGPSRIVALAERGHIRARTGRPDQALADFTDAIAIQPALELYLARGRIQESMGQLGPAAAGYQAAIARLGAANPLTTALIRVQVQQGEFRSALALVDNELTRAPIKTGWLLRRAEILSATGQNAEADGELQVALEDANKALQKRPTAIHLLARAKVLLALGRLEEAREDLQICIQISPRFVECNKLLNTL